MSAFISLSLLNPTLLIPPPLSPSLGFLCLCPLSIPLLNSTLLILTLSHWMIPQSCSLATGVSLEVSGMKMWIRSCERYFRRNSCSHLDCNTSMCKVRITKTKGTALGSLILPQQVRSNLKAQVKNEQRFIESSTMEDFSYQCEEVRVQIRIGLIDGGLAIFYARQLGRENGYLPRIIEIRKEGISMGSPNGGTPLHN
jgi:hypothetical protein